MKKCSSCQKLKPYSEFGRNKLRVDGLHTQCKECISLYSKEFYQRESKTLNLRCAEYRSLNTEARRKTVKKTKLKHKYGLTLEEAEEIYSRGCQICGTKEGKLCIDHCHETSKVRGCLCDRCNKRIGQYELFLREDLIIKFDNYLIKGDNGDR